MSWLGAPRRIELKDRKPRKDMDVPKRAVMAYLSWIGLSQLEIAEHMGLSPTRVCMMLRQSTWPYPTIHNWRAQKTQTCVVGLP